MDKNFFNVDFSSTVPASSFPLDKGHTFQAVRSGGSLGNVQVLMTCTTGVVGLSVVLSQEIIDHSKYLPDVIGTYLYWPNRLALCPQWYTM